MDPEKLGVVVPPKEEDPGEGNLEEGKEKPTEDGSPEGQEKKPEEGSGTFTDGDGTGKPQGQTHQPENAQKRVNDLMSKWQTEQSAHKKTGEELDAAKKLINILQGKGGAPESDDKHVPSYRKPGWKPESYEDLSKAIVEAEEHGFNRAKDFLENKETAGKTAEQQVESFMSFFKTNDSEFDPGDFEDYVNDNNFSVPNIDALIPIYRAYVGQREAVKAARVTVKPDDGGNKEKQPPGTEAPLMTGEEISGMRNVQSVAQEMLSRFKGKK